jgi:1-acyl-sn-glycerol-3-phosphate acyltransferase
MDAPETPRHEAHAVEGDDGPRWLFYRFIRLLSHPIFFAWFRLRSEGLTHVPRSGALIVAANHVSYLDPAVLGSALPRPSRFIVVAAIWKKPLFNWFFRRMRAIPVARDGSMTRGALKEALDGLAAGHVVCIFPEGGRANPDGSDPPMGGVALLARRSGAAVLPAGISGTHDSMPRGAAIPRPRKIVVEFGEVMQHREQGRAADLAFTTDLMQRIRRLAGIAERQARGDA